MATCLECNKGWNSWGSYDDFCSDECENTRAKRDKETAQKLLSSLTVEQIKQLDCLLSSGIGIDTVRHALSAFGHLLIK